MQTELFTAPPLLPEGFVYEAAFLTAAEESALLDVGGWQHGIAPTKALRYSITLRTARRARA